MVTNKVQFAFKDTGSPIPAHHANLAGWVRISEIGGSEHGERGHILINSTISDVRLPGLSPSAIPLTTV